MMLEIFGLVLIIFSIVITHFLTKWSIEKSMRREIDILNALNDSLNADLQELKEKLPKNNRTMWG